MAAKKTVTVEQYASANRRPQIQTQTLIGLGLIVSQGGVRLSAHRLRST